MPNLYQRAKRNFGPRPQKQFYNHIPYNSSYFIQNVDSNDVSWIVHPKCLPIRKFKMKYEFYSIRMWISLQYCFISFLYNHWIHTVHFYELLAARKLMKVHNCKSLWDNACRVCNTMGIEYNIHRMNDDCVTIAAEMCCTASSSMLICNGIKWFIWH